MGGFATHKQEGAGSMETPQPNTLAGDLAGSFLWYVVYFNPSDFPGEWVIRRMIIRDFDVVAEMKLFARGKTLKEVREALPSGLVHIPRHDEDDPVIWETWV